MDKKLEKMLVGKEITIKKALKLMDETGEKALFIVDEEKKLLGALTDGDVRRAIIRGMALTVPISSVYAKNPVSMADGCSIREVKDLMLRKRIECIPVLDKNKRVTDILIWDSVFAGQRMNKGVSLKMSIPVVIMAGGKGTRLDPFTRILPKPLIPIGKKPIIEIIMDNFAELGYRKFYVTVNYKGEMIKSYFDNTESYYKVKYIWEKKYLGTIGGLRLLPSDFPETFFVTNCDVIIKADYTDMISFHRQNNNDLTLVGSLQHYEIPYGVLKIYKGGRLKSIDEKPEYDFLVNAGLYLIEKRVVKHLPKTGLCNVTDFIAILREKNLRVGVYPVSQNSYIDVGEWKKYQNTLNNIAEKINV